MSRKSSWDKFRGERLRALAGTLGGAAPFGAGVTTLGGGAAFWEALMRVWAVGLIDWDLV